MSKLEELRPNASVQGILPNCLVSVINAQWFGSEAIELTYKDPTGKVGNELLYRHDEARFQVVEEGRPWSLDGEGALFRLVSEAQRIRLAHLFDPVLAVHTSVVDPLPHQITAVYEAMLPRLPLRFLLADDPGAGKTIMAGLLMKELIARGDMQRCLVVCPGSLAEQWQDELWRRFHLPFEILTNDKLEAARTGNWFLENHLVIARLDKLSRNADVQAKLEAPDGRWDLVVVDEAHKMSATFFGGEIKYTKRYRLGQLLSQLARHFLLMSATPHNGKEEDFQLFMALLDGDRFEGRFRDGVHAADVTDLMRRMVKEDLLKFDGTPLFPERIAYTVPYKLSDPEARLYREVTDYVREEFNRAEALENDGRAGTVGFALTILQRRLASSPEAIYQSLRRRRERLESRLRELELLQRGGAIALPEAATASPVLDDEDVEDLEDAPDTEVEEAEETILDQATAARTVAELKTEIATLKNLEALALSIRRSGEDRKWRELANLLTEIFTPAAIASGFAEGEQAPYAEVAKPVSSPSQKLVIFTEHRDTLNYLRGRISAAATYLYQDGARYWYATQATVTKLADDRAEQLKREPDKVAEELERQLREDLRKAGEFGRVHMLPHTGGDVPDDYDARLVVLAPEQAYSRDKDSAAELAAREILESRGSAPRLFRNTLVFLAADKVRYQDLDEALRKYLAWDSIVEEQETLNLDPFQAKQAENQKQAAAGAVAARLPETYQWLLVPEQPSAQAPVEWHALRLSGAEPLAVRASKKLRNDELLITNLAASRLRMELDRIPLWRGDNVATRQVIDDFARYLYLPRVQGPEILANAMVEGITLLTWSKDSFGYADSFDEKEGRYRGLRCGQIVTISGSEPTGLLVKPDVASQQQEAERPPAGSGAATTSGETPQGSGPAPAGAPTGSAPQQPKRFHGSVKLDATRVGRDAGRIADEVIAHLTALVGSEVKVTLEIEAQVPNGVPENTVRTVTENSRTLKFDSQGFEKE